MHNILKIVFIAIAGMLLLVSDAFSEGFEFGEIIESIPEAGLIQVNNHIFKVGQVTVVTEEKEYPGDIRELKEGGVVRILVGKKAAKYWDADMVTLYSGDMAEKVAEEMDMSEGAPSKKELSLDQPENSMPSDVLRLKNGVWQN